MSDNPFAKYQQQAAEENPFAKYRAPPPPAAPSGPLSQDEPFFKEPIPIRGLVDPVINFLTGPARDLGARIGAGAVSPPIDPASRAQFYQRANAARNALALPESSGGQAVSQALSLPGQVIGAGAQALGNAVLGPRTAAAVAPYAGAAADVLPLVGARMGAARAASRPESMIPRPEAMAARNAGYVMPPGEIMERPGIGMRALAGGGGKYKTQQVFSEANQANTDSLARQAIGLKGNRPIRPVDFDLARAPAKRAYDDLDKATPRVALSSDPKFRQEVETIGVPKADVEKTFPDMAQNPSIVALRKQVAASADGSTAVIRKKIADLRFDAQRNFRALDANSHQLGLAQRQAADVLENAVERSIGYGRNGVRALGLVKQAEDRLARARSVPHVYSPGGIPGAMRGLERAQQALRDTMAQVTPEQRVKAAEMLDQFRDARRTFAKVFDIEAATNRATGHVNARRLATMRRSYNRPFTGSLKAIADAYDAFPHLTQEPTFGREDYSVFDAYGAGASLLHGHPVGAAAIMARAPIRRALTGPRAQARMFRRPRPLESATSGALAGAAATPQDNRPLRTSVVGP